MPPKKTKKKGKGKGKGKGKKSKKNSPPAEPDEFDLMDEETLRVELGEREAQLAAVREARNEVQQRRDEVQQLYEVVHREVLDTEAVIRNIETEMGRMEETHRNDIRIYLQKVIHLEYEHANNVETVRERAGAERDGEVDRHNEAKLKLKEEVLDLEMALQRDERTREQEIAELRETQRKQLIKLREEFESNHERLSRAYDEQLLELQKSLELRRKMEIHEIEERKNRHINDLMANHERAFSEMRTYYNSMTRDNLELIRSLKEELADLKAREQENAVTIENIRRKNELLEEPLEQARERVTVMEEKLKNYEADKASLKHVKARLMVLEGRYQQAMDEHDALQAEFARIERERDELYDAFETTVAKVQRHSEAKNAALERQLAEYTDAFEQKHAQFGAVLRAADLDPVVLDNMTQRLNTLLSGRNDEVRQLKYEVAKVQKAHDDLVRVYEAKLGELGLPEEELGVRPLMGDTMPAPANLI